MFEKLKRRKLTKGDVDRIKPGVKDGAHLDDQDKGFCLRVIPKRKLSFMVQARADGTNSEAQLSIGPYACVQCR